MSLITEPKELKEPLSWIDYKDVERLGRVLIPGIVPGSIKELSLEIEEGIKKINDACIQFRNQIRALQSSGGQHFNLRFSADVKDFPHNTEDLPIDLRVHLGFTCDPKETQE